MILSVVKQSSVPLFECASFRPTELCFTCLLGSQGVGVGHVGASTDGTGNDRQYYFSTFGPF